MMDEIPVLAADLEELKLTLTTLYNAHSAQDLVEQYRKLDNRNRRSPLTNAINGALLKVESYLAVPEEEQPDE